MLSAMNKGASWSMKEKEGKKKSREAWKEKSVYVWVLHAFVGCRYLCAYREEDLKHISHEFGY